jgi:ABC-2 type transport system permease protein
MFVIPMLTMRAFAEEKATGTMELLMTSPVREVELVVGKYLAACSLYFALLVLTLQYPAFLIAYGEPDLGPLYTGYLGLMLIGMAFIALGLFTSSLTANQIVAAVMGFVTLLLLYVLYWPTQYKTGAFSKIIQYVCVYSRVNWESDLSKGILDTRDLVFFASFIFIFLFLSVRSLASSRWR